MSEEKPWLRNWPEGVPQHIPDYESIPVYEFLRRSARNHPDRKATVFYEQAISYSQLDRLAARFAAGLRDVGLEAGETLAIMLPNTPQFLISFWSTWQRTSIPGRWSSERRCRRRSWARFFEEN